MKGSITLAAAAAVLTLASVSFAQDASTTAAPLPPPATTRQTFQLDASGNWSKLETPTRAAPTTPADATDEHNPALAAIADLVRQHRYEDARADALRWLLANKGHPLYDRGLYLMASALRGTGQYIKAFYYCDELLDEHADSPLYQDALQLQYEIADTYLLGAKDRFVGLRILGRQDEAVDMLFRIQTRAPGSAVAENALLRTADYYYATEQFDLAADAYHAFARSYPRNPIVPEVLLREAYANLQQFRSANFDSTSLLNARELFRRFKAEYPEMAAERKVDDQLVYIERQLARKLYDNADFYRRTGRKSSAIKVCQRLVAQYPNLPEADEGRKMLARLGAPQ